MLKKIIIVIILLYIPCSYGQELCILKNDNYIFSYIVNNNHFLYKIKKNDNSYFTYFEPLSLNYTKPIEFGIKFGDEIQNFNIKINDNKKNKFNDFYKSTDNYFHPMSSTSLINNFLIGNDYFDTTKSIEKTIDLNTIFVEGKKYINKKYLIKDQKIYLQIRIILDTNLNECLIFNTGPINEDFSDFSFFLKKLRYYYNTVSEFFELNLKAIK